VKKLKLWSSVCLAAMLVLSGCGGGSNGTNDAGGKAVPSDKARDAVAAKKLVESSNETVELQFMMSGNKANFDSKYVTNPVLKQKFPNVTLNYLTINDWDNLIASGVVPDVVDLVAGNFYRITDNNLTFDHTNLLKEYNFDYNKFTPEYLEIARKLSNGKGLVAIPDKMNFPYSTFALAYNKDLFDQFAVPYPKDGMSWSQVIDLSKKFRSATVNGTPIHGLTVTGIGAALRGQAGLNYLDTGNKINFSDPTWSELFKITQSIGDAQDGWSGSVAGNANFFTKDKTVAMLAGNLNDLTRHAADYDKTLNWDMVTYPHLEGQPVTLPASSGFFVITPTNKHKELTMAVLKILLEDNADLKDLENPEAVKKNMNAMKNKKMPTNLPSKYDGQLNPILQKKLVDMVGKKIDSNTALREVQEELQKKYAELVSSDK
jgi:multiple sugar transport system substrate-binding protein